MLIRPTNAQQNGENHAYGVALHSMHDSFAKIHKTPQVRQVLRSYWGMEEIASVASLK
jgi:hypothetical protein